MEPEVSVPYSQEPVSRAYSDPDAKEEINVQESKDYCKISCLCGSCEER
jgi:hypothetical protein